MVFQCAVRSHVVTAMPLYNLLTYNFAGEAIHTQLIETLFRENYVNSSIQKRTASPRDKPLTVVKYAFQDAPSVCSSRL